MKTVILTFAIFAFLIQDFFAQPNTPNKEMWITNAIVSTITSDANFYYLGGAFSFVGPNTGNGVKLSSAGVLDMSFPTVNGSIHAVVSDGIGGWYIGGDFTRVGDHSRNYLAHINANGTVDENWNPNPPTVIRGLAINGTHLYVAGGSYTVSGQTRYYLVKINRADATIDATWNPNPDYFVTGIVLYETDIFVRGSFDNIGGRQRTRLAKLNTTNGAADAVWSSTPNNYLNDFIINGDYLYVAGHFTSIGGVARSYLARLSRSTGAADPAWNPNPNQYINDIEIISGDVYVGGAFTSIGGVPRSYIAKLSLADGLVNGDWNPSASSHVSKIVADGSEIYVVGSFLSIGGSARKYLAKLNSNGTCNVNWNLPTYTTPLSLALSGTNIYMGGQFSTIGGAELKFIARINKTTGLADPNWNPNPNLGVESILVDGQDIFVGGSFSTIGGQSRNGIAKLNYSTGVADNSWNANASSSSTISTIVKEGTSLYIGGSFDSMGGVSRNNIAKIDKTTGVVDNSWNPNANSMVKTIALTENHVFVGGGFDVVGGAGIPRLAKLNKTDGNVDPLWNPEPDNVVNTIVVDGTTLFVGGDFNYFGTPVFNEETFENTYPYSKNFLAKLNINGIIDDTWNVNPNGSVLSAALSGTALYICGSFLNVGAVSQSYLAKLNKSTGVADAFWTPLLSQKTNTLLVENDQVLVGGEFSKINDYSHSGIALFSNTPLPVELISFTCSKTEAGIVLNWNTATESDNYGFEIERLVFGNTVWNTIGFVAGAGNSNATKSYSFTDNSPTPGKLSYRLKQIDVSGGYEYSSVVEIDNHNTPTQFAVGQNYPNPFNPETAIEFTLPVSGKVKIIVYSTLGEVIAEIANGAYSAGTHKITWNAVSSGVASGVYFYEVSVIGDNGSEFREMKKMTLLK